MKEPGKKVCRCCGRPYHPDPRTARFQKACGREACQRARRRQKLRRWRVLHPDRAKQYQPKVRAWARAYPDYWRHYRATHPRYMARDKRRRVEARRRARLSAKETAMPTAVVEKLEALEALPTKRMSAKETPILRRVGAIEDCLRSTVSALWSAKRNPMASAALAAG